ncbi:MAG TPA: hypothetical protein PLH57_07465, partial [Oligoflexia bacterium]|nr:hypothetical protein [Oligoflexia bacterium]
DAFNPNWLKEAIDTSSKPVFIFAHTSLRDKERYSGDTAQTFSDIGSSDFLVPREGEVRACRNRIV